MASDSVAELPSVREAVDELAADEVDEEVPLPRDRPCEAMRGRGDVDEVADKGARILLLKRERASALTVKFAVAGMAISAVPKVARRGDGVGEQERLSSSSSRSNSRGGTLI